VRPCGGQETGHTQQSGVAVTSLEHGQGPPSKELNTPQNAEALDLIREPSRDQASPSLGPTLDRDEPLCARLGRGPFDMLRAGASSPVLNRSTEHLLDGVSSGTRWLRRPGSDSLRSRRCRRWKTAATQGGVVHRGICGWLLVALVALVGLVAFGGCASSSSPPRSAPPSSTQPTTSAPPVSAAETTTGPVADQPTPGTCRLSMRTLSHLGADAQDSERLATLTSCASRSEWIADAAALRSGGVNVVGTSAAEADVLSQLCSSHSDTAACR
jgi:hypothetical protein